MIKEKSLRIAAKLSGFILCVAFFGVAAEAQKRRTVRKAPARTSVAAAANNLLIKESAQKVSTQIKNVSKFIYVLGGVAKDIETLDKDIRDRKILNRQIIDKNERDKQLVVQSIANLQAGLAALETDFSTKPALRAYSLQIQGIGNMAGNARSEAAAGQLTQSGKTLLLIVERLSDVLAAMP